MKVFLKVPTSVLEGVRASASVLQGAWVHASVFKGSRVCAQLCFFEGAQVHEVFLNVCKGVLERAGVLQGMQDLQVRF